MTDKDEVPESISSRLIGPLNFALLLLRVPIAVTIVMVLVLLDFVIPGSMREALRFALTGGWYQLGFIAIGLVLVCAAIRITGEVTVELVSPEIAGQSGLVGWVGRELPSLLALLIAIAVAISMAQIAVDPSAVKEFDAILAQQFGIRHLGGPVALAISFIYAAIGVATAVVMKGRHKLAFVMRDPTLFGRLGFSLFMLALAGMFVVAVLGVFQPGVANHALEKTSTAFIGAVSDDANKDHNLLKSWVYTKPANGQDSTLNQRYYAFIQVSPVVTSQVSATYVLAQLLSLFLACVAVRLAVAVFLDLMMPGLGRGGETARFVRCWSPRAGSVIVGVTLAAKLLYGYLIAPASDPYAADIAHFPLSQSEMVVLAIIAAVYIAVSVLASLPSGSDFLADGPWYESPSVGRRFIGAARRIAALSPLWGWLTRGLLVVGIALFLFFVAVIHSDFQQVEIPQFLGPVSIVLLWGATAATLFFPLAYLAHLTRIPFLAILFIAALAFAGFNLNDNHELSTVDAIHTAPSPANGKPDQRPELDLKNWIASRADWDQYDHYPVFLVATEGGGMRAAYFTATVLAALQDRCPAFAQHTLAISGVSGGSLGASIFAALAADHAKNNPGPGCALNGGTRPGQIVSRARQIMSVDLLSPLLGAALFPDAVQRAIPVPVPSFDRARALEHAVEASWRSATPSDCRTCDPDRLAENAMDMYGRPPAFNAVPNLFLNTTEAGTGNVVPYETVSVRRLSTPFRNQAEIDDGHLDCAPPVASITGASSADDDGDEQGYCLRKPASIIETRSLQSDMQSGQDRIRLSTAAILSARFPYLTPAGGISATGHHYVDGGYFENSGTWLITGLLQNLIGQQFQLQSALRDKAGPHAARNWVPQTTDEKLANAATNARFILIVIQSEPCTRRLAGEPCDEDATVTSDSWNEALSPLRALLSTRETRAEYSYDGLGGLTALIQQLRSRWQPGATGTTGANPDTSMRSAVACDYPVCNVTLRFLNSSGSEIPLTWVLSRAARLHMDNAVDGMEAADVRTTAPLQSRTAPDDPNDIDRVLGSYRRVLCVLASRRDALGLQGELPIQQEGQQQGPLQGGPKGTIPAPTPQRASSICSQPQPGQAGKS